MDVATINNEMAKMPSVPLLEEFNNYFTDNITNLLKDASQDNQNILDQYQGSASGLVYNRSSGIQFLVGHLDGISSTFKQTGMVINLWYHALTEQR
uniref:Uncharacterized protein n=1 Tax=Romanomermis culicivorax TaxID=13658 RepID=A0A915HN49_ROMCU